MERYLLLLFLFSLVLSLVSQSSGEAASNDFKYKKDFLKKLVEWVPDILKNQDPKTGRFGKGIWIVNDQHSMYPLAAAWAAKSEDNPYYHDTKVLEAVMAAGDALIEDQDKKGMWEFRKKDGSTWGQIYMPWTYSRWIRSYGLIREGMPPERLKRWEDALKLGFTGISKTCLNHIHNIPTHDAMGLYIAGELLERPEWCAQAREFMAKVVEKQDPNGFWSENHGPVVSYNAVYVDALGVYYSVSGDETVRPAIERAARFHANFTYPDGARVETIDERNPYHEGIVLGTAGCTYSPEGRGYVAQQLKLRLKDGGRIDADFLATFLLYGEEGSTTPTAASAKERTFVTDDHESMIRRKGPWFICLSAYHCDIPESRWIQDRQNMFSVFHDRCGLIVGGGNTKLQPLWSNFTVGDTNLLKHKAGDTNPKFTPKGGLVHVPAGAALMEVDPVGIKLKYGEENCEAEIEPVDDNQLRIRLRSTVSSGQPVEAHITLIPHIGKPFKTELTRSRKLEKTGFTLTAKEAGSWMSHAGWKLTLPQESTITWPVLPHNPYRKDGSAEPAEGRIVISMPFSKEKQEYEMMLVVE